MDLVNALDKETLTSILLYHVSPGERFSGDVVSAERIRMMNKGFVFVDGTTLVGNNSSAGLNLGFIDIDASNGVIHVVDTVLIPLGFELEPEEPAPTAGGRKRRSKAPTKMGRAKKPAPSTGVDRKKQLLEAVVATGTPVVLVLVEGRPRVLGSAADEAQARALRVHRRERPPRAHGGATRIRHP